MSGASKKGSRILQWEVPYGQREVKPPRKRKIEAFLEVRVQ